MSFAVAILKVAGDVEQAAQPLAQLLGKTAYDMKLELAAGTPALVLTTTDKGRAADVATQLRGMGHDVLAFDRSKVVGSQDMISMKRLRLNETSVTLDDQPGQELPYGDVWAVVRANHRFDTDTRESVQTKKLSPMRAIATGGFMLTKATTEEVRHLTHEKVGVLYLYRRSGGTPWILRENGTNYAGLGAAIGPSQLQNFNTAVALLRERMPDAPYDDRLLTMKRIRQGEAIAKPGTSTGSSSVAWTDLLAHVIAFGISQRSGAYRRQASPT